MSEINMGRGVIIFNIELEQNTILTPNQPHYKSYHFQFLCNVQHPTIEKYVHSVLYLPYSTTFLNRCDTANIYITHSILYLPPGPSNYSTSTKYLK